MNSKCGSLVNNHIKNNKPHELQPFLKWPGGKRWLFKTHKELFPDSFNRYFEPFLGGGAVFYGLSPDNAFISDLNADLINLYIVMRDNPDELAGLMDKHHRLHNESYYYEIRGKESSNPIEDAARLLYLNRTCFNGMYRVNKAGKFNVPIGTKNNCIYDIDLFKEYSVRLQKANIQTLDFEDSIGTTLENDFIFADPPYTRLSKQNDFLKYNDKVFSWHDQIRLFNCLNIAKNKGVKIMLTNANCEEIIDLYSNNGFEVSTVSRMSAISGKVTERKKIDELIIRANY